MSKVVKKIGLSILIVVVTLTIWYLFVKSHDFNIVINAKTSPGTVYNNILSWNTALNKSKTTTVFSKKNTF